MRFEHCHVQPLCTPTRVQLMTGQYNFRNYKAFGIIDPRATSFAHLLKSVGYATCVVGKWQLYGSNTEKKESQAKIVQWSGAPPAWGKIQRRPAGAYNR